MAAETRVVGLVGAIENYDARSTEWNTYKGRLTFYFEINEIKTPEKKRAALLTLIGNTAYRMLADLHAPNELSTITYDTLIGDLDKSYGKKVSKMASRLRFGALHQHEGQSVDDFIAELRHASLDCAFGGENDNRLKDQFVLCLHADHIKKKLLEDEDRSLADVLKKARDLELIDREHNASKAVISGSASSAANYVRFNGGRANARQQGPTDTTGSKVAGGPTCFRCGRNNHAAADCYYSTRGYHCRNCGKAGHAAQVCRQPRNVNSEKSAPGDPQKPTPQSNSRGSANGKQPQESHHVDEQNSDGDQDAFSVMTVHSIENVPPMLQTVQIGGVSIDFEVDSGSCYSLLNTTHLHQLG